MKRGRNLERYHGFGSSVLPIPATFVVGTDGLIKSRKRMDLEELLAALNSHDE